MFKHLIIGALVLIAMYAHAKFLRWRERHLEVHAAAMEEFIAVANVLIKDDETPVVILKLLRFMRKKACDPRSARHFLWFVIWRPKAIGRHTVLKSVEEFERRRPELAEALSKACATAFEALAYRSPFIGIFLRVFVIFDGREHANRTQELAENYCALENAADSHEMVAA